MRESVGICLIVILAHLNSNEETRWSHAHFSSSAKSRVLNLSSQPTSTRILMPPSSSRIDCDALEDDDWAPRRGVKVNILRVCRYSRQNLGAAIVLDQRCGDRLVTINAAVCLEIFSQFQDWSIIPELSNWSDFREQRREITIRRRVSCLFGLHVTSIYATCPSPKVEHGGNNSIFHPSLLLTTTWKFYQWGLFI